MQKAQGPGVCKLPKPPASRALCQAKRAPRAAFPSSCLAAHVLFVIQMTDVKYLHPNDLTDPDFGKALRQAAAAGVQVLAMDCRVTPETMTIGTQVNVTL